MPTRTFTVDEINYIIDYGMFHELKQGRGRRDYDELFDIVFSYDDRMWHVLFSEPLTEAVWYDRVAVDFFPDAVKGAHGLFEVECPEVELYVTMVPVMRFRKVADVSETV